MNRTATFAIVFLLHGTPATIRVLLLGAVADYRAEAKPWPFESGSCDNVEIWHGTHDSIVPVAAALHNQAKIPKAMLHRLEGWGHELGVCILNARLDSFATAASAPMPMRIGDTEC